MNRQKYLENLDYREGYLEGIMDGKNQVLSAVKCAFARCKEACDTIFMLFEEKKDADSD